MRKTLRFKIWKGNVPTMDAEEHGENASDQQVSLNRANDTGIHSKRQASTSQENQKRIVQTSLYTLL